MLRADLILRFFVRSIRVTGLHKSLAAAHDISKATVDFFNNLSHRATKLMVVLWETIQVNNLRSEEIAAAYVSMDTKVFYFNVKCNTVTKPLAGITFKDSVCHVYRWDRDPFELVFERGFQARGQANTPIETYYNLKSFVHGAGRPLETIRDTTYGFISTTLGWCPPIVSIGVVEHIYHYEIYVPGGILVPETLGES
ncbi:hypothetical protein Tco_1431188 [Tanacetum coccineum]